MTQSDVKAALDRAFDAYVEKIFSVLVGNIIANDPEATSRFANGLKAGLAAHGDAAVIIENLVKP